ncbi:MAG: acetyltransferase [Bryobacteraceae bacterium]
MSIPEPIVVLGSGGHAKVIIDILQSVGGWEIMGCVSPAQGKSVLGIRVAGDDSILPHLLKSGVRNAFVAIGDNYLRQKIANHARTIGFCLPNAVSPRAIVSQYVKLGCGIAIMPGAVVNADTRAEDFAIINTGATVDHDCVIGSWAHIGPGANLAGEVHVGQGAFVGTGARVIPKRCIGDWTVVGAGAVVIRDLPAQSVFAGVPARELRRTSL